MYKLKFLKFIKKDCHHFVPMKCVASVDVAYFQIGKEIENNNLSIKAFLPKAIAASVWLSATLYFFQSKHQKCWIVASVDVCSVCRSHSLKVVLCKNIPQTMQIFLDQAILLIVFYHHDKSFIKNFAFHSLTIMQYQQWLELKGLKVSKLF